MHKNNSENHKCINCTRAGIVNLHPAHTADSSTCPCFINYRKNSYSNGISSVTPQQYSSGFSNAPPQQPNSTYQLAPFPSQLSQDITHRHNGPTAYQPTDFLNNQRPQFITRPPVQRNMAPIQFGTTMYANNYQPAGQVASTSHLNS